MKKIIPFTKDIKFNTKIYEITSISLENTLTIEENNEIDGEFIVSGDYKMNDSSINTEPFIYGLPFDITLDDYYNTDSLKLDIDDFKYEILNEEILRINIDVLIEGTIKVEEKEENNQEQIDPDVIIEARKQVDKDNDEKKDNNFIKENIIINKEIDNMTEEKDLFKQSDENITKVLKEDDQQVTSIFDNFNTNDEKYVSYYVHIVRENDTLETISIKYNVSIDDIKEYNDLQKVTLGNKILVPYINNDTTI